MRKINKDYLDTKLRCPINGQPILVRFIPESLYERYYIAYPFIFEEENKKKKVLVNDISTTEYREPSECNSMGELD